MDTTRVERVNESFKGWPKHVRTPSIDRDTYLGVSTCNAVKFGYGEKGPSLVQIWEIVTNSPTQRVKCRPIPVNKVAQKK